MKKQIGTYTFELVNDTIYIRETATKELLKAKTFRAHEAVDKFTAICKHWEAKFKQPAF